MPKELSAPNTTMTIPHVSPCRGFRSVPTAPTRTKTPEMIAAKKPKGPNGNGV